MCENEVRTLPTRRPALGRTVPERHLECPQAWHPRPTLTGRPPTAEGFFPPGRSFRVSRGHALGALAGTDRKRVTAAPAPDGLGRFAQIAASRRHLAVQRAGVRWEGRIAHMGASAPGFLHDKDTVHSITHAASALHKNKAGQASEGQTLPSIGSPAATLLGASGSSPSTAFRHTPAVTLHTSRHHLFILHEPMSLFHSEPLHLLFPAWKPPPLFLWPLAAQNVQLCGICHFPSQLRSALRSAHQVPTVSGLGLSTPESKDHSHQVTAVSWGLTHGLYSGGGR
ncbi:unnamed protein product [Rangifer tarandus platyrhynchus]|uniref:Uncharacterized protein n=2 Tax=Rangifer tarandus platyrhynchus TaxID=3082113 RepID=A0ACB0E6K4_RANTA|nr:unnamed protein product [Rangifer tarandus platyrhynchus]CAI9696076.1 unnamed protein product [Rangifer tarandus platyrhynchus]